MGKHPTGLCDLCQVEESIEHILLQCNKENISSILKNQCLIYKSDFNLKSVLDIGGIQTTVFNLVNQIYKEKIL